MRPRVDEQFIQCILLAHYRLAFGTILQWKVLEIHMLSTALKMVLFYNICHYTSFR